MPKIFAIITFILIQNAAFAQVFTNEKLKIFLNCNQEWLCDSDYLRNELKMVDFVRDRFLCDVQVIMNVQFTSGGGESNTLSFQGQNQFSGMKDTLIYFNTAVATQDIKRKKMLQQLKLGLIQFIAKSPIAEKIEITYKADSTENKTQQKKDPWNFWQFSIGASGFFNGNRNSSSQSIYNSISASRETEKNRFFLNISNSLNREKYSFFFQDDNGKDTFEVVKVQRDQQDAFGRYVIKLTDHWGTGLRSSFTRSIFQNIDTRVELNPMIEYSIFPYKDFNSQRIVLNFDIGPQFSNYRDTTIYFKSSEVLFQQNIGLTTSFTKPWGSINVGVSFAAYIEDFKKNNTFIGGGIEWNIVKGLKFGIGGNLQFIHDQISIPKAGATRDDLLTQRRILATSYDYFMGVGFSYTFGSIFNSQVNPTFKGLNYSLNF